MHKDLGLETKMDFDRMNETDVREVMVRPFLERLGYKFGTDAHIRTEVTLRYSKAFLGRKDRKRDPDLQGRADYICEVIPYGRWVVEVKAPSVDLSIEESQQAHTYATHPEIAAFFYLITNGKEWRLYQIGRPDQPLLTWSYDQVENIMLSINNIIGPEALKKRSKHLAVDTGKPLGNGLNSRLTIRGGYVTYSETKCNNNLVNEGLKNINGQRAPITSGSVYRNDKGEIEAHLKMLSMNSAGDNFLGEENSQNMIFLTRDEFISTDAAKPTIFTNMAKVDYPAGSRMPAMFGMPAFNLPVRVSMAAFTQAVGYFSEDNFRGTFEIAYLWEVETPHAAPMRARQIANLLQNLTFGSVGDFDLVITN